MGVLSKRFTLTHCDVNTGIMHRPVKHWWYLHCVEADTWNRLQLEIQISWIRSTFNDQLHKLGVWDITSQRYKCMLSAWNRPVLKSDSHFIQIKTSSMFIIEIIEMPRASAPVALWLLKYFSDPIIVRRWDLCIKVWSGLTFLLHNIYIMYVIYPLFMNEEV